MRIEYLADHPDLVPALAALHLAQWGYLRPGDTVERRISRLREVCTRGAVPTAVVGVEEDGRLAGSAMLVANDMETRRELTPWLAGLLVIDELRGQGRGAELVRRIEDEARAAGARALHLYTPDAEAYYARLGWTQLERATYLGHEVAIMRKRL